MQITKDTKLQELISADEKVMEILVPYGFDCCCGAFRPLGESAVELGLDAEKIISELETFFLRKEAV